MAEQQQVALYVVGGVVRDLLLGRTSLDLDLVAENGAGAAVRLGEAFQGQDRAVRLEIHGKYQTVALTWPDGFAVDIATARTEFYPQPGANPQVEAASLAEDLYRRDFTINAMAVALDGPRAWQLVDPFGGRRDLEARRVRVLHPNSFIDDPTRIFRAVRFACRLDFVLAEETVTFVGRALGDGLHDRVGGDRLKTELEYLLQAPFWLVGLEQLAGLDALRCIDPGIRLTDELRQSLQALEAFSARFASLGTPVWQLRLERLLLEAEPLVAEKLYLSGRAIERLGRVRQQRPQWAALLSGYPSPATLHRFARRLSLEEGLLLASLLPSPEGFLDYLGRREQLVPLLTGADLRSLGLSPGPHFREILDAVVEAQLEGELRDPTQALAWVRRHYPPQAAQ